MKYTRYDLKRDNKKKIFFIILIIIILILAFISGTIISNLFIKNGNKKSVQGKASTNETQKSTDKSKSKKIDKNKIGHFTAIQCGVFNDKNNAKTLREELCLYGNPFVAEEKGKNKVILGIYTQENLNDVIKLLEKNNLEFSKINFNINLDDTSDIQIAEIVDAYIQIINKFSDKRDKLIQTSQLKEWVSNLKDTNNKDKNYNILKKIKDDTKSLPKTFEKDDIDKYNMKLYKVLQQMN